MHRVRWWALLARVLVEFARVERVLRREPIERAATTLGVPLAVDAVGTGSADLVRRDRRRLAAVRRVAGWWPFGRGTCLREALVLGRLLPHLRPRLRLGVRRQRGAMIAHAWVDLDGLLVGGALDMVELTGKQSGV